MGNDKNENALIKRRPTQNAVLPEGPVVAQCGLDMHEVTALAQTHLLGQSRQLIQVRRIIGYSPYPGLRQFV